MTDQKNNPEAVLEAMINRNVKLQFAEYCFAALSIGGTIAVAALKNTAAFAAIPLTVSVCLNLWNRRELDQLTRQRTFADATEIKRSLAAELQALRSDFEALPGTAGTSDDVEMTLASLSDRMAALDLQVQQQPVATGDGESFGVLEQDIAQLKHHHIELAQSLVDVKEQFATAGTAEAVPPELTEEVATLKDAIAQLEARPVPPDTVIPDLEPVRAELQAMITPVQSQVSALSDKLGLGDFEPGHEPANVGDVQTQFEGMNTKLDSMFVNVSDEMNVFRSSLESTQGQVQDLQTRLGTVQEAVQAPEALDAQVQTALTPLKDHLSGLESRMNDLPVADPQQAQAQAEELQTVQSQLRDVGDRLDQVSNQVSTEVANLPQLVAEQVKSQVDSLPQPAPAPAPEPQRRAQITDTQALDDLLADLES